MLVLPPDIQALAEREPVDRASEADLAMLRGLTALDVRQSYREFISTWGYIRFDPLDDPCEFTYAYREPGMATDLRSSISMFMPADKVAQYYHGLVLDVDEDLPKFPAHMLPICFTPGQSHVLLECGGDTDRVWFWEFRGNAWREGAPSLGFVAETFQDFLNGLRVPAP